MAFDAKGQVCTTDHDVDLDWDGNARLDVLCLLIKVFAESTNVHSSLQVMGACMQSRKRWTALLSRSKQLEQFQLPVQVTVLAVVKEMLDLLECTYVKYQQALRLLRVQPWRYT